MKPKTIDPKQLAKIRKLLVDTNSIGHAASAESPWNLGWHHVVA